MRKVIGLSIGLIILLFVSSVLISSFDVQGANGSTPKSDENPINTASTKKAPSKTQIGQIKVIKQDTCETWLKGLKFEILNKDGDIVDTLVTNENGIDVSKRLPIGEYTLIIVDAPKGAKLSSNKKISVTVKAGEIATFIVTNKIVQAPPRHMLGKAFTTEKNDAGAAEDR